MNIIWNEWRTKTRVSDNLSELEGEVIASITGGEKGDDECVITTVSGKAIKIYHNQDCCEHVSIEDCESDNIVGGFVHFAGFVDGVAEDPFGEDFDESFTWSFLKIETSKGSVWQRWLGTSNGYYSESVDVLGGVVDETILGDYKLVEDSRFRVGVTSFGMSSGVLVKVTQVDKEYNKVLVDFGGGYVDWFPESVLDKFDKVCL